MKDGWHKIKGFDVYVEKDHVIRGTTGEGTSYRTVYPYKSTDDGLVIGKPTVAAFRHDNWTMR